MSKYIIEIEEKPLCVFDKDTKTFFPRLWRVKGFNSLVLDEEGLRRLEELNSDYINEHFGDLQDTAYDKGYAQCQDDYGDALKHAKDTAYQKGLADGKAVNDKGCEGCKLQGTDSNICDQCCNSYANQWKSKDDKIEVGDVVETQNKKRFIVTALDSEIAVGVCADGLGVGVDLKELRKTGKHFDIDKILKEMKGDNDK